MSDVVRWTLRCGNGVTEEERDYVHNAILSAYDHPLGWRRWGYTFEEVPDAKGNSILGPPRDSILVINYKNGGNFSGSMSGFSYYDPTKREIHINHDNWEGKVSAVREGYYPDVRGYQTYIINHETGHHLENVHGSEGVHFDPKWKRNKGSTDPSPVMVQQTRCPVFCENMTPNPYPLSEDRDLVQGIGDTKVFIDNDQSRGMTGGGGPPEQKGTWYKIDRIIALSLLFLFLITICYLLWSRRGKGGNTLGVSSFTAHGYDPAIFVPYQ